MPKRSSDLDRLLDDVEATERERRIAWARSLEGVSERERAAIVRCVRLGAHEATTTDLRTSLAAMDRLGIGQG